MYPRFAGMDGCRAGWFCVVFNNDNSWTFDVYADVKAATEKLGASETILIDMPIGLIETGNAVRSCDLLARKLLSQKRGSSVFTPPARATLTATNYRQALAVNHAVTSRGLSKQSWNIVPKIRQVDNLLRTKLALNSQLRESHPEICFWALNHRQAMLHNKKTSQGRTERLCVLERFFPDAWNVLAHASQQFPRRHVALDDIVDALVLAVVAKNGADCYSTLPVDVPRDDKGLRMEMVYWSPSD